MSDAVLPSFYFWLIFFLLVAAFNWLAWRELRRVMRRRQVETARHDFAARRAEYEQEFFTAAAASGKPRGLRWTECRFRDGPPVMARDRATGGLVALVGVTIAFAAVEGGGMEDVEAVGNLRSATATFTWDGRRWTTQGRAVFNLEPQEVVERYGENLRLM